MRLREKEDVHLVLLCDLGPLPLCSFETGYP
jgi:hypothetical protein